MKQAQPGVELQAARLFAGNHQGAHQAFRALLDVGLVEVRLYIGVLALSVGPAPRSPKVEAATITTNVATKAQAIKVEHLVSASLRPR